MKILGSILIIMLITSCSFKKDSTEEGKGLPSNRQDIEESLTSKFEKLAWAIVKDNKKLFFEVLKVSNSADINQLTSGGSSLLELAIKQDSFEYFNGLLEAGASPFMPTAGTVGVRYVPNLKKQFRLAIVNAEKKIIDDSVKVCAKNDVDLLQIYMKEHFLDQMEQVCGRVTMFEHFLDKQLVESTLKAKFVYQYLETQKQRTEIASMLVFIGFKNADKELLGMINIALSQGDGLKTFLISSWIKHQPLKDLLPNFLALKESITEGKLIVLDVERVRAGGERPPLTPPPPMIIDHDQKEYVYAEDVLPVATAQNIDLVSFVKNLLKPKLAEMSELDMQIFEKELRQLELM